MAEENAFDLALGETNVSRKECSSVEEGDYVLMQGRPCKIVEMSASRRNRHGHSKVHLVGIDIFTGKKFEDMSASTHEVEIPEVSRGEYRLLRICDDGTLCVESDDGETKENIHMPNSDLADAVNDKFDTDRENTYVDVISCMGEEAVVNLK